MLTEVEAPDTLVMELAKHFDKLSEAEPGSEEWAMLMAEIVALQDQMEK